MIVTSKTKPMNNPLSTYDEVTYYSKDCEKIKSISQHVLIMSFKGSDSIIVIHKNAESHDKIIKAFMNNECISFDSEIYSPDMIYRYEDFTKWLAFGKTAKDRKILGEPKKLIEALVEFKKENG